MLNLDRSLVRVIFQGVELVDNDYFITEENVGMLKLAKEANTILVYDSFTSILCRVIMNTRNYC